MSQETELDDLDLDKLLDDEDFLEDFDFEEPVADSGLQAGDGISPEVVTSGAAVSPAGDTVSTPGDSAVADGAEPVAARSFLKKILFPASLVLAVLLLVLQIYAAWLICFPKIHIHSEPQKIAVAEVITRDLAEKIDDESNEESPQVNSITFDFHYPLYSLAGLKILGVEVQLVFPPQKPSPLGAEQIEQLKKIMHDSLDQAVGDRMLEELGKYDDFFVKSLRESLALTLKQWHLPPATIRLEGLVVH